MVKGVRVRELGGPEVLKLEDVEVSEPGPGEVRIKHTAIGVNFVDVYLRKGWYSAKPDCPFIPGFEAAGVVKALGQGVSDLKVGDRVAYATPPLGAYVEERNLAADRVVKLPDNVSDETAAAIMLKGMTAQILLKQAYQVEPGQVVLVQAAAGGMGSFLCQWASAIGATVIGTVSSQDKAEQAIQNGCKHPIIYTQENFVDRVKEITGGKGVSVVYESVGKDTFVKSLDCLAPLGTLVAYGWASGRAPSVHMDELMTRGSLTLVAPMLYDYLSTRDRLIATAEDVFAQVTSGKLEVRVNHRYPLAEVAAAHRDLEGRKTSGCIILTP